MSTRNKILISILALVLLGLLILMLRPAATQVNVSEARTGYFAEWIEDEGRTRLRDPHRITAPVAGYLRRVVLEPGDSVQAGDSLFELEAHPAPTLDTRSREQAREAVAVAQARLEAAEAELEARQVQYALAHAAYIRNQQLYEDNLISTEQIERIRAERDASRTAERVAHHAIEIARFELEAARVVVQVADGERARGDQPSVSVRAPISGVITHRYRYSEGPVNAGEDILVLGNMAGLEAQVDLLSMDAMRVRPGMRVIFERWGGDATLEGRVLRVEPGGFTRVSALGVDEQRVPVRIEITSDREDWSRLGDGYRLEARFILWEDEDILQIPTSALFRSENRWSAFVVEDGRARLRQVQPGRQSGLVTQILDGIEPGESVITHPGDYVEDGTRVSAEHRDEG